MEIFTHLPAILRILLVLALVMGLMRVRLHLGLALVVGSVVLALFFQMPVSEYFVAAGKGLTEEKSIFLALLIVGILILSGAMNKCGQMERLVNNFRALVGESRLMLVAFPAMIGLLPMPGGAVFSAPMIGEVSQGAGISAERKTVINYWFRHIWEYWLPLYPGVILAIGMTEIEPSDFILLSLPMTFVALGVGYLILLRSTRLVGERKFDMTGDKWRAFLWELIPVLIMVFSLMLLGLALKPLQAVLGEGSLVIKRGPIYFGMIASIGWVVLANRMKAAAFGRLFLNKSVWGMVLLVVGLMIFKAVLEEGGAVMKLQQELTDYQIPLLPLIAILAFIAGLVVGIAVGYVGVSFAVIMTLISGANIPEAELPPYIFFAYFWGYMGMMLSPVHLCLLLTRDYFKAQLLQAYRYLIPLSLGTSVVAMILFYFYQWLYSAAG